MVQRSTRQTATNTNATQLSNPLKKDPASEFPDSAALYASLAESLADSARGFNPSAPDGVRVDIDGFTLSLDTAAASKSDAKDISSFDYVLNCLTSHKLAMGSNESMENWRDRQTKFVIWENYSYNGISNTPEVSSCE